MARIQTLVQLTDDLVQRLDHEAARRGVSRSALVRQVLQEHLDTADSVAQAIVDGYRRMPQAEPDAWGAGDDLADRTTLDILRRLDEEEHQAEAPPW